MQMAASLRLTFTTGSMPPATLESSLAVSTGEVLAAGGEVFHACPCQATELQLIFSYWLAACALDSEGVVLMECQLMSSTLACIGTAQVCGQLQQGYWHLQLHLPTCGCVKALEVRQSCFEHTQLHQSGSVPAALRTCLETEAA